MKTERKRKVVNVVVLVAMLLIDVGCHKKADSRTSSEWISSFSTLTSSIALTPGDFGDLRFYSGVDPSGNLYLSGSVSDSWTVLKSSDRGATWNQEFSFGAGSSGGAIASDSVGNIFSVGYTNGLPYRGTIRKFDANAQTWSTVHSFQQTSGRSTYLFGVAVDRNDHIYAVGSATVTQLSPDGFPDMDVTKMVVLKSSDHGGSWSVVDLHDVDDHNTSGVGVLATTSGKIYTYASGAGSGKFQAVVRMSNDGGVTWNRVFEDYPNTIRSLTEWNGGILINEEYFPASASTPTFRVRGTMDDFAHLMILDSSSPSEHPDSAEGPMRSDVRGYVYHSSRFYDSESRPHLVLRATRGDGTWEIVDDLVGQPNEVLYANDVMFDDAVGIFNVGTLVDINGNSTLLIRKATLLDESTFTPPSFASGTDLVSPVATGNKRIFLTHQSHDGNWGSTAAGAIANADAFCSSDSNKPLLGSSTYKALLVNSVRKACTTANCTGGVSENLNWVLAPNTTYVTREGIPLGTTNSAGIFTTLSRALKTNTVSLAWTGLDSANRDWTVDTGWDNCADWTTNDNGSGASVWTPRGASYGDIYSQNSWWTCDNQWQLLCVEQ